MRREKSKAMRTVKEMNVEGSKGRGRPKKRWFDAIKSNMRTAGVCVGFVKYIVLSGSLEYGWLTLNG